MDKLSQLLKSTFLGFFEWLTCWHKGTKKEQENQEETHVTTTQTKEREFEVMGIAMRGQALPGIPKGNPPQTA